RPAVLSSTVLQVVPPGGHTGVETKEHLSPLSSERSRALHRGRRMLVRQQPVRKGRKAVPERRAPGTWRRCGSWNQSSPVRRVVAEGVPPERVGGPGSVRCPNRDLGFRSSTAHHLRRASRCLRSNLKRRRDPSNL